MSDLKRRIANLSFEKRALFENRLVARDLLLRKGQEISPREDSNDIPLSFSQQRLWFLDQFNPGSALYNVANMLEIKGSLDVAVLELSINKIIHRHEVFRTTYSEVNGQAVQLVSPKDNLKLAIIECDGLQNKEKEIQRLITEEVRRPFDLAKDLPIRSILFRLNDKNHILLLILHHIACDLWSMGILYRELMTLYKSFLNGESSPLSELAIQYADFAIWQRKRLQSDILQEQLSYWKEQLDGAKYFLDLPIDKTRPASQSFKGTHYLFALPIYLIDKLKSLSFQENSTLFMSLFAGFSILLFRYTSHDDLLVGSPVANRHNVQLEEMIGFFVNTLVLRTNLSGGPTFKELLGRVREVCLEAYENQDLPFEKLVEELQPERELSHSPVIQVLFNLQNAQNPTWELPNLNITSRELDTGTSKFDLTLTLLEKQKEIMATWEYDTGLFNEETIIRLANHYQTLLESIVADPDCPISQLPLLSENERQQLLEKWNDTKSDYPQDKCFYQLFEEQALLKPSKIAVEFGSERISYHDLNNRANQLAHYLRDLGVGPNVLIGLFVDRSIEMMIGLLGIMKAGGAYVPLDPDYPKERLSYMLEESQSPVLITQRRFESDLPESAAQIVFLDSDWPEISRFSIENLVIESDSERNRTEDLAYVIFTSGSTGKPKGVQVPHRAVTNFLLSMSKQPGIAATDNLLAVTTLSFDIHVLELYTPLIVGGKVVIASRETAFDGELLAKALIDSNVTVMQATPSTWRLMCAAGWNGSKQLKALCGGEAFPRDLIQQLIDRVGSLWNMYGPTETTVWSTCHQLKDAEGPIVVGRPIDNTQTYVLDTELQPVPVGVTGELYIGGDGVTHGYLNRPDLTSNAFIADPFSEISGTFIYKTGDLVKYHPDGNIEYIDRLDNQIKLRGHRIELGEIEANLSQHPSVIQAAAKVHEFQPGDQRLIAYLVLNPGTAVNISEVRKYLRRKLPDYMIPQIVVEMQSLPLTPAGKVDRKSLPEPFSRAGDESKNFIAPRTEIEEVIAEIWKKVLDIDAVSIHDNFFEIGGHSLLSVAALNQLKKSTGISISIREFILNDLEQIAIVVQNEITQTTNPDDSNIVRTGKNKILSSLAKAFGN